MAQVNGLNQISGVDKFGVPVSGNSGLGILMPKLKHRFRVVFFGFGTNINTMLDVTRQVATVARPTINYSATEIHSYNNIAYVAQKPVWSEIALTLRDDITNLATSQVSAQVQRQMNHYSQSAAASGRDYKFDMVIQTLDGSMTPVLLEQWKLEGCYIQQAEYDTLDYSSSDITMINLTIRYDNALQGNEKDLIGNRTLNTIGALAATAAATIATATP